MRSGFDRPTNPGITRLEAEWWKDWWAQDFSWEGLKAKTRTAISPSIPDENAPIEDERSLQMLWHDEESWLIVEPGTNRKWTRLHCPYVFADGTPSPKASWSVQDWQSLEDTIVALSNEGDLSGLAWLSGAVLQSWPFTISPKRLSHAPAFHIVADYMHLSAPLYLSDADHISAPHAWLGKGIYARSARLIDTDFGGATFVGNADFVKASFYGSTRFANAQFLGVAAFDQAHFTSAIDVADFSKARFSDRAEFPEVRFGHEAVFNGARFAGRVNFYAASFEDRALFDDIQCLENIHFYKAAFVRRLTFSRSVFYRKLNLEGITDGDPISLSAQPIELHTLETDGKPTGLSGELKPSSGPTNRSYRALPKLIADQAVFHYDANFSNRDILSPSTFENARFHHLARFHGSDLHANASLHQARFKDALNFRPGKITTPPDALLRLRFASQPDQADFAGWKKTFLKARLSTHASEFAHDSYYEGLESSYRTLKQTMEDRRDRVKEGEFFTLELVARRKRHDVPMWETAASWLYWGVSDYGNSIFRPLILMTLLFAGLGLLYFLMAERAFFTGALTFPLQPDQGERLVRAFSFSWSNIFAPFHVLDTGKAGELDEWTSTLLGSGDARFNLTVRVIATLQSLLTLTLAFLAGLAGRRRFQIN